MKALRLYVIGMGMLLFGSTCGTPPPLPPPSLPRESAQPISPPPPPAVPGEEPAKPVDAPAAVTVPPSIHRSLPESVIAAPAKDSAARSIDYGTMLSTRTANPTLDSRWHYRRSRQGQIVGFEFSNHGGNAILPPRRDLVKNQFFTRDFQFRFDDRARQDIHLMISDWVPSRDRVFRLSELMNSLMHFFPRRYLPAIVNAGAKNIVTLPTGEEVEFNAVTKEIVGGVLAELPVDLNPAGTSRAYPGIAYRGGGVLVRADARGTDPRLGTLAAISSATPAASCDKPKGCGQCQVPSKELWEQSGAVRFKFSTDEEFDKYLTARCGFGLPRQAVDIALPAPKL